MHAYFVGFVPDAHRRSALEFFVGVVHRRLEVRLLFEGVVVLPLQRREAVFDCLQLRLDVGKDREFDVGLRFGRGGGVVGPEEFEGFVWREERVCLPS